MAAYLLSAIEVKDLTKWPDAMVDEWLEAIKSINELVTISDSVRGNVTGAGVGTGNGFTVVRTGTGSYTVTFSVKKDNINYIVLPSAGTQDHLCSWINKTVTGFGIRITTAGSLADSDFSFMAKE